MTKIRIGIIGTGQIGKKHLEEYARNDQAELVAVADVNEPEARRVAEQYQIPHVYTDYKQLLQRDDLDAVDVCLHNNFHAPITIAALEAGKHVYCEKPIAGSYADGKAMVEAAKACGKKLHIQIGTLYRTETKVAKMLIDEGKLGRVFHARSNGHRRRGRPYVDGYGTASFTRKDVAGGGALFDMGVYHIAQMMYLLGNPTVERVTGKIYQEIEMDAERRQASQFDVEELAMGFVHLQGGITLDIQEAWAIHMGGFEGSSIVGSQGGIKFPAYNFGKQIPLTYYSSMCNMDMNSTFELDLYETRMHQMNPLADAFESSQRHWVAALQGRVDLLPTAEIALQTSLISEGIYLSDLESREFTAQEIMSVSKSLAVQV